MNENNFMRVDDVARELGISKSYAYKIVQKLNAELREKGYLTISGRDWSLHFYLPACVLMLQFAYHYALMPYAI